MSFAHPFCSDLQHRFIWGTDDIAHHLVLGVDESVIDALSAVAEVEDGVDFLSSIKRFGAGDLAHALVIWELLDSMLCWQSSSTWNSSWESTMQQEVTR